MQSCFKDRRCKDNIYGTKIRYTKTGFALKLVFIRHRSKQSEYIVIANTDLDLSAEEIISLYARRFSIEGIFRGLKSYLKLTKFHENRKFATTIANFSMGLIRFITLEWMRRISVDMRSIVNLFYDTVEELHDMPFGDALASVYALLQDFTEQAISAGYVKEGYEEKLRELAKEAFTKRFESISCFIKGFLERFTQQIREQIPNEVNIDF